MPFRVAIDGYHGPLDLLLYLVRKEEVAIGELPLARLTEQYLAYVELIERLDVDAVGEFLDVASLLLEIKSRRVLPVEAEAAAEETLEEPRGDLVAQLLAYQQHREIADALGRRAEAWRLRRERAVPLPKPAAAEQETAEADRPVERVEVWDLVAAFARVMKDRLAEAPEPTTIQYDDTPVSVHMRRVDATLRSAEGVTPFEAFFAAPADDAAEPAATPLKSTLIGVFLAVLELVRHGHALAEQREAYGPITLRAGAKPLPAGFGEPTPSGAAAA